jgi:hypothetical protein
MSTALGRPFAASSTRFSLRFETAFRRCPVSHFGCRFDRSAFRSVAVSFGRRFDRRVFDRRVSIGEFAALLRLAVGSLWRGCLLASRESTLKSLL